MTPTRTPSPVESISARPDISIVRSRHPSSSNCNSSARRRSELVTSSSPVSSATHSDPSCDTRICRGPGRSSTNRLAKLNPPPSVGSRSPLTPIGLRLNPTRSFARGSPIAQTRAHVGGEAYALMGGLAMKPAAVVRSAWEAFSAGDVDRTLRFFAPDAEWRVPEDTPGPSTYTGHDELRVLLESPRRFSAHHIEITEISDMGGFVLAHGVVYAELDGQTIVDRVTIWRCRVEGGVIANVEAEVEESAA